MQNDSCNSLLLTYYNLSISFAKLMDEDERKKESR